METEKRLEMLEKSGKSKKLTQILQHTEFFERKIDTLKQTIPARKPFIDDNENAIINGNDISVCVRVRPLLQYEKDAKLFSTILANHPQVVLAEPKFTVKGEARIIPSTFNVDFAFGPENDTEEVYERVAEPILDVGLQGGVSTIFAYGQTASGKTFTISAILTKLIEDLLLKKSEHLELYISLFEILGNCTSDLLEKDNEAKVDILEDKFGKVNVTNTKEVKIENVRKCLDLIESGMAHRKTATTFKNDTSSRSHAICQIRVVNQLYKSIEDGKIFVVDLAGSETASDSQFHGKTNLKETQAINKSLMSLKDCIRNRALATLNPDKFYHVPYRNSKLTLLLKDAFELESKKLCKTVVIANVAPSVQDVNMSLNTLRYAAPLKIGQSRDKIVPNPDNPANWTHETLVEWVHKASKNEVNCDILCPYESGMQLLRLPEAVFIDRVLKASKWGEKRAVMFYKQLWSKLVDARTKDRKDKLKAKDGLTAKKRLERDEKIHCEELIRRENSGYVRFVDHKNRKKSDYF